MIGNERRRSAHGCPGELSDLLTGVAGKIDVSAVVRQYEAVDGIFHQTPRSLPDPVWKHRLFEHDGTRAWQEMRNNVPDIKRSGPISVYVHIPLCDRRCTFCDCYSLTMQPDATHLATRYVEALLREIREWSQIDELGTRAVTTVHFGGGTPNCLGGTLLEQLVGALKSTFRIDAGTELALESTSSLLTHAHLRELRDLGFTRLHVGVQSLTDGIRRVIGRRELSADVLQKLSSALELDFILSADIIYGLPQQTGNDLLQTLSALEELGLHGMSLYQLQESRRNRRHLRRMGALDRSPLLDYGLLQIAEQFLSRHGYSKNHFTHFARPQDANLYCTHTLRGEDLLALGATADGLFGPYHYRHGGYADYVSTCPPSLEGGLLETDFERRVRDPSFYLMGGGISSELLKQADPDGIITSRWLDCRLIQRTDDSNRFVLTANGSWFMSSMLADIEEQAGARAEGRR